jgi:hypothetical protein
MQTSQNVSSGYVAFPLLFSLFSLFSLANPSFSSFCEPRLMDIAAVFALARQVSYVHSPDSIEIYNVSDNWWNRPIGTAGL